MKEQKKIKKFAMKILSVFEFPKFKKKTAKIFRNLLVAKIVSKNYCNNNPPARFDRKICTK